MASGTRREVRAAQLRHQLADRLVTARAARSPAVQAAMRRVPRHLFTPGLSLEAAYANDVALLKRDAGGTPISSVSAPDMQAIMLEQAAIRPGMSVLEIGSGGYNAALLAELVRPAGSVVTVDIDPDVAARARECLDAAGYRDVRVVLADADAGVPDGAPYDRIVVTVEAWDLPPAWVSQLTPDGRIVAPVRIRGLTRSMALDRVPPPDSPEKTGPLLISRESEACGFVKMRGAGAHGETTLILADELELTFDEVLPEPEAVGAWEDAVRGRRAEAWSDVLVWRGEGWGALPFWLAAGFPGFCGLTVNQFRDTGLTEPALTWGTPAAATPGGLVYLTTRNVAEGVVELGAQAFGARAGELAAAFVARIHSWDREHRDGPDPGPEITVWRRDGPVPPPEAGGADLLVEKRHTWIAMQWP